ncbi:laminin-like protein epi-1 [Exaiptasia diaphana]|uniref:Laminin EGF-like domain-containing protein n=1 Tax=Exaiptasia diaphana TaxID=2652724 RepID=A0A913XYM6_EXADI|nr:laminin-like protein epi-1 [Exaiptasia diaphana]KXJ07983.1 Laminin subunit alpha-1 [Exaiptasia diaphana]
MAERESVPLLLGFILFSIAREILVESRGCNNTTQGPYNCKCASFCSLSRIKRCYFTRKRIQALCVCKEGHTGAQCNQCKNGWYQNGNFSDPTNVCIPCNCTGNLDLTKINSCDQVTGKCIKCASKTAGEHCERCASGFYGDAVVAKNCTVEYKASHQGTAWHVNKEAIVIATCSSIGAVCIIAIAYLIYQRHKRFLTKGRIPKFWTVEISNRNYDDLDFSLLDPVTDTPFVYRNDTRDFEEALIAEDSKAQLRIDVDTYTAEFEDTSF